MPGSGYFYLRLRAVWRCACLGLLAALWVCPAAGQPVAEPKIYTVPAKEALAPTYVVTGAKACMLVWAPGTYRRDEPTWRVRLLDAQALYLKLEATLTLEKGQEIIQSVEGPDGLGCYLLLRGNQIRRQLTMAYLRYGDAGLETERYLLPFDLEIEELLVSNLGAYIRGVADAATLILYLNPDTRQGQVLPFGPDKATRMVGCGIEPATGRFWLALVRKGRNPGPLPSVVRLYAAGAPVAEHALQGFGPEVGPTTLLLATDSVQGLWLGAWGKRGSEYAQGPLAVRRWQAPQVLPRFVDSAGYWRFEPARQARRHHERYRRRQSYLLSNRFYFHPLQRLSGGGYALVAERYLVRQTHYPSTAMSPVYPYIYGGMRMYETTFALRMAFGPGGTLRGVESLPLPTQVHPELAKRSIVLPDRPALVLQGNGPRMALADASEPGTYNWVELQPAALGIAGRQSVSVEHLVQEGPVVYAFGQGRDEASGQAYFFLSRLPDGPATAPTSPLAD